METLTKVENRVAEAARWVGHHMVNHTFASHGEHFVREIEEEQLTGQYDSLGYPVWEPYRPSAS